MNIRQLVDRVEALLGPDATPLQVEKLVEMVLSATRGSAADGTSTEGFAPVAAVCLGLPLQHCASRLPQTVRAHAYDTLRRAAAPFRHVVDEFRRSSRAPSTALQARTSPLALLVPALDPGDVIEIAQSLDEAAEHAGLDELRGCSAFLTPADPTVLCPLLEALPNVLRHTKRLHASIDAGDSYHPGVVARIARIASDVTDSGNPSLLRRLSVTTSAGPSHPVDGHFLPIEIRHPMIDVRISSREIVRQTLASLHGNAAFPEIRQAVRQAAFAAGLSAVHLAESITAHLAGRMEAPVLTGGVAYTPLYETGIRSSGRPTGGPSCACSAEDHVLEASVAQGVQAASSLGRQAVPPATRTISVSTMASIKDAERVLGNHLQGLHEAGTRGVLRFHP